MHQDSYAFAPSHRLVRHHAWVTTLNPPLFPPLHSVDGPIGLFESSWDEGTSPGNLATQGRLSTGAPRVSNKGIDEWRPLA